MQLFEAWTWNWGSVFIDSETTRRAQYFDISIAAAKPAG